MRWLRFSSALLVLLLVLMSSQALAAPYLLVPMDLDQTNHLKAYGLAFHCLQAGEKVTWLLNYRGGSFLMEDAPRVRLDARLMGVLFTPIDEADRESIRKVVAQENMDEVLLEKPPHIAVYSPPNTQPWDDAVTMALTYAEVPYDVIYDQDVLAGKLGDYDWLHLHHEDFTGQYGKFYATFGLEPWYLEQKQFNEDMASALGFNTVWELKHGVAATIRDFVDGGGFLFAMCSATDTIDIALAWLNDDIVPTPFDGTPIDPDYRSKADFEGTFAFENFKLVTNPLENEFSNLDTSDYAKLRGALADYHAFLFRGQVRPGSSHADPGSCQCDQRLPGPDHGFSQGVPQALSHRAGGHRRH